MEELPKETENGCNNAEKKKQMQKSQEHKLLCELLLDFAKNTTLHGLRYVTERGLSLVEKIFWVVTFLISLSVCVWLMGNVWVKWQTTPIIVTLSEKLTSITEVPFPAVTICPQAKIKQKKHNFTENMIKLHTSLWNDDHYNISEAIHNLTQQNPSMKIFFNLNFICNDGFNYDDGEAHYADHSAVQDILKMAPQELDILQAASWWNDFFYPQFNESHGNDFFDVVLTNEGMCFTYNSLAGNEIFDMKRIQTKYSYLTASTPRKNWSLEWGYTSSRNDTYPRRGRASSTTPDLVLHLQEVQDRDIMCDGFNRGFKVYLHHPAALPQSSLYHYAVSPGEVASFAIKVNVMKTSDTLMKYTPQIRQCYFPSEKKLRYFRVYTLSNCQLECSTNYTLNRCNCAWFHMPHDNSTALCEYSMKNCVFGALEEHATDDATNSSLCKCLPSCDSVQYEAEVIKTEYYHRDVEKANLAVLSKISESINKVRHSASNDTIARSAFSKIEMYFKEPRFVSMRRSELFGLTDFLANCGGLLGLFLGFSFLSLVEIFYFFTLRFSCKLRRNKVARTHEKVAGHLKIV